MDFGTIKFPTNWKELNQLLTTAYNMGKDETTYKLQCCANCKNNDCGRKCSKAQSGECVDYSCWQIHDYDGVEM